MELLWLRRHSSLSEDALTACLAELLTDLAEPALVAVPLSPERAPGEPVFSPKDARARGLIEGLSLRVPRPTGAAVAGEHLAGHRAQVLRGEAT